jgi:hypothetical protein
MRFRLKRVLGVAATIGLAAALVPMVAGPADAAPGAQPDPTIAPFPVATRTTTFSFTGGATCDGTGSAGWRAHTFIVNENVDPSTLDFSVSGAPAGYVGIDFDSSNGTIAAPLYKGSEDAGVNFLPATSPAGFVAAGNFSGFNFDPSVWTLTDGNYKIGFACVDGPGTVQQWWSRLVRIDVDASSRPFLTQGVSVLTPGTPVTLRSYGDGDTALGNTNPGSPNGEPCLIQAASPVAYGGLINGSPGGGPGQLNVLFTKTDQVTAVATCVPETNTFVTDAVTTIAANSPSPLGGGSVQIGATTSLHNGTQALRSTVVRIDYSSGQVVKLPTGAVILDGALSGGTYVVLQLKPLLTKTTSVLDLAACSDKQYIIDSTEIEDAPKANSPHAYEIGEPSTTLSVGDPGTYVATIRNCAQSLTPVPGKLIKSKILVTGDGEVIVSLVKNIAANPQVWDPTRGLTCLAAKTNVDFTTDAKSSSRILSCKGNYGEIMPFNIDERSSVGNTPGQLDTYGILHPAAPQALLVTDFS